MVLGLEFGGTRMGDAPIIMRVSWEKGCYRNRNRFCIMPWLPAPRQSWDRCCSNIPSLPRARWLWRLACVGGVASEVQMVIAAFVFCR